MSTTTLLGTITGEPFQPVRLHYQVFDQNAVLRSFSKLRCLKQDPQQKRWCWLYDDEAKHLSFQNSYERLGEKLRPIVIGSFFLRGEGQLLLDLRSCERALLALPFFDRHIPRSAAKAVAAEVVNRLFPLSGNERLTPADLFDRKPASANEPEGFIDRIEELAAGTTGRREKLRQVMEYLDSWSSHPLPEIERLPLHFYEDGIDGFVLALRVRQLVARKHHVSGERSYGLMDALKEIMCER